jgi:hypothetical protein
MIKYRVYAVVRVHVSDTHSLGDRMYTAVQLMSLFAVTVHRTV